MLLLIAILVNNKTFIHIKILTSVWWENRVQKQVKEHRTALYVCCLCYNMQYCPMPKTEKFAMVFDEIFFIIMQMWDLLR